MKSRIYISNSVLILLCLITFWSCKESSHSRDLLQQAQSIIEKDPEHAMQLLDSIRNPEAMDTDSYMQYIVANVQAKFKNYKDITTDTLIYTAQKYFDEKGDMPNAALAHFYAGCLNLEQENDKLSISHFLKAKDYALKTNNNVLAGKSLGNISYFYFNQHIMDTVIVLYQQALKLYEKEEDTELSQLMAINAIGRAYEDINNMDSAYLYFSRGLDMAELINDEYHKYALTLNLGVVYIGKKEYDKAIHYLHRARSLATCIGNSSLIDANLSIVYSETNQMDSARHYTNIVKEYISQTNVKDYPSIIYLYETLIDYNKKCGNLDEALQYSELLKKVTKKMMEHNSSQNLSEANQKHVLSLKQKEAESAEMRSTLYIAIAIFAVLLILALSYIKIKNILIKHQQEIEKNKSLETENELLKQRHNSFRFLQNIYLKLVRKWSDIDKEVKDLAIEYGATDEPTVYKNISKMVEDIQSATSDQLLDWARDYFKKQPFGEQIIASLPDKELLLLMLRNKK